MSGTSGNGRVKNRDDSSEEGFSAAERAAMKARAAELKAGASGSRGAKKVAADEAAVLSAIAEMAPPDRVPAELSEAGEAAIGELVRKVVS